MKFKSTILLALFFIIQIPWLNAEESQTSDARAYKKVYQLVLDEKWKEAIAALEKFIKEYPQSDWQDDAQFWLCYAKEKNGADAELVFKSYEKFVEKFPQSRWADDAHAAMIRVGQELAEMGKVEYREKIEELKKSSDEQVSLAALHALQRFNDNSALPAIISLYDRSKSEEIRANIAMILSRSDAPQATDKLVEIALNDQSEKVRKMAIMALTRKVKSSREAIEVLKNLAQSDKNEDIKKQALMALSMSEDSNLIPFYKNLALKYGDDELSSTAIMALSRFQNAEAADALTDILMKSKSVKAKKMALMSLRKYKDPKLLKPLLNVIEENQDKELTETAIILLSEFQSEEAQKKLENLVLTSKDEKIRKMAVSALRRFDKERAMKILLKLALEEKNDELAEQALLMMQFKFNQDDVPALMEILHASKSENVKMIIFRRLIKIDEAKAIEALAEELKKEKNFEQRERLISIVNFAKSDAAVDFLADVAKNDASVSVRKMAIAALSRIGTKKAKQALVEILEK